VAASLTQLHWDGPDLVEQFMRGAAGTLDALSRAEFDRLARESLDDVLAWHHAGAVDGITLARYCAILGMAYPLGLDTLAAAR
jgi:hypothetical protein